MSILAVGRRWVQLPLDDPSIAGVTVTTPDGGDLFALSREMVIRAGHLASHLDAIDGQLAGVKEGLQAWVREHAEHLREAYVVLKGDGFLFLVVQKGKEYHRPLEDSLTELDLEVARIPMSVTSR